MLSWTESPVLFSVSPPRGVLSCRLLLNPGMVLLVDPAFQADLVPQSGLVRWLLIVFDTLVVLVL